MADARWFPMPCKAFCDSTGLIRRTFRIPCGQHTVEIVTDAEDLLTYYSQNNKGLETDKLPDATLIYLVNKTANVRDAYGLRELQKPPCVSYYDAAIDVITRRVLFAGIHHYGLMKSIVSGLSSFVMASETRQGVHGAAFSIGERGILLAGGAEAGKTTLFLRLLSHVSSITTEDWCDVCLAPDRTEAIGIERNMSINTKDVASIVQQNMLPSFVLQLNSIPHGHRDKIVFSLERLCGPLLR